MLVGLATCGIASGAKEVMAALQQAVEQAGLTQVDVIRTGCIGLCQYEPLVEVVSPTGEKVTYIMMNPAKAREMVESHLVGGKILEPYTICTAMKGQREDGLPIRSLNETDFYRKQYRIALKNCGVLDPENVDEYVAAGGYQALAQVLQSMTPNEVIQTVLDSGLRGRGGGGFPTGRKWQFARQNEAAEKYVCCNADEGDPGAFMDRSVLEGDPHVVLEAMAIGARQGYIYVRAEYPIAVARLELALRQAREKGFLGQHIFGTEFSFEIGLRLGAGAFVCGEETALLTSIEGNRGEPRPRPPFPAKEGLFGKPTILNNVETFANIPAIITRGAAWFSAIGTEKSKGTKVFALG
ncbi:MAG: NADH-quinone oxidoreductase subunit F, partial [Clostridiales bacterium]